MPTYPKNFLKEVICRVDFPPILALKQTEPAEFQERIRQNYPRLSKRQEIQVELTDGTPSVSEPSPAWVFEDMQQKDQVTLAPGFLALSEKEYVDFPDLSGKFQPVYDAFLDIHNPPIITRIGLRYINEIRLPPEDPLQWDGLINSNLTASLRAFEGSESFISRSMQQLHLNKGDYRIRVNYGVFNTEYPNQVINITRKEFILDYDGVSLEEHPPQDVIGILGDFNREIEDLFESSIGDDLRAIMKGETDE